MINLIKCGAFDKFGDRVLIMEDYLCAISGAKKKLTLQNVGGLIENDLIPDHLAFAKKVFNFNKYIKKFKNKETGLIELDPIAFEFYENNFDLDLLQYGNYIDASTWKNIYDRYMATIKAYIVSNHNELLKALNGKLTQAVREKYAQGDVNKWSMDSVCYYQDKHELEYADLESWGCENFFDLPEEPQVQRQFPSKDGHMIKMFYLTRIAGTVIDKNKQKNQITLLTKDGVVTVQAYGVMAQYDKQISEVGPDGHKHVLEKSWFTRGNKIIVNGMRRGDTFVAKKYKNDPGHHFYLIKGMNEDGSLDVQEERIEVAM